MFSKSTGRLLDRLQDETLTAKVTPEGGYFAEPRMNRYAFRSAVD